MMKVNLQKSRIIPLQNNFRNISFAVNCKNQNIQETSFLGILKKKDKVDINLDLGCFTFQQKKVSDIVYSSQYNSWFIQNNLPLGKATSIDHSINYFESHGTAEIPSKKMITIDLENINQNIDEIYLFLNIENEKVKKLNFSLSDNFSVKLFNNCQESVDEIVDFQMDEIEIDKKQSVVIIGKMSHNGTRNWSFESIGKKITKNYLLELSNF